MDRVLRLAGVEEPADWLESRSAHFIFHFVQHSAAERNIGFVAARLESLRDELVRTLKLPDVPVAPVRIFLTDSLEEEEALDEEPDTHPNPLALRELRAVYRLDAPGGDLDRNLVQLLLAEAWPAAHTIPPLILDGLLGYLTQRTRNQDLTRLNQALIAARRHGTRLGIVTLLGGPSASSRALYYQAATSFTAYLLEAHTAEAFRTFAERFDPNEPNAGAEAAYGRPFAVLEQAWLGTLRETETAFIGITDFLRRSWKYLQPNWKLFAAVLACLLIAVAFETYVPLNYKTIIDGPVKKHNLNLLFTPLAILFVFFIVYGIVNVLKQYLGIELGHAVMNRIQQQMFDRLQALSMAYFSRNKAGDIVSRFSNDVVLIEVALVKSLPVGISILAALFLTLGIIILLDWRMSLAALVALGLVSLVPRFTQRRVNQASYEAHRARSEVTAVVAESYPAQAVVSAFGLQRLRSHRFRHALEHLAHADARLTFLSSLIGLGATIANSFVVVFSLALGAFLVIEDEIELGTLVAFITLLKNVEKPIKEIGQVIQSIQMATGGLQRLDELLEEQPQVEDAPDAAALPRPAREIRFEDVVFSYTGEQVNLSKVSFTIPYGQSAAIVGPSGCGKSTIINLLLRHYDPTSGTVSIDGWDLRRCTQASIHEHLGVVLQDNFLFNASVRENIRMGRLEASDAEIEAAAQAAEVHDQILALPQGYDTLVGERGSRISGGLRQRIAIARALLRNPAILLMDEATSALDPHSEQAVNATLRKVAEGRTMLFITHRLMSVADFDRIFVLERGRLVEEGTHQELIDREGVYYRMWQYQTGVIPRDDILNIDGIVQRMKAIPMFARLDPELLATFAARFTTDQYDAGEIVFEEGDPGDKLYLIVRGRVEIVRTDPTGEEQLLADLRDGDYFGEVAFYRDVPRAATARTRADSLFLVLDRKEILKSVADILNLPDVERHLVNWIRRMREVSPQQVAEQTGRDEEAALTLLNTLVAKGYVQEVERDGEIFYRPRLASTRGRQASQDVLKSLTEKI